MWENYYSEELCHHGIKGMKWGVRRFQNKDGTLTPAGKKRYDDNTDSNKTKKSGKYDKYYEQYKILGYDDKRLEKPPLDE